MRKGILLLTVYALHLLFYQALMAMPAEQFSAHFSSHHQKNIPCKNHPTKSEYRILLKHEDEKSPAAYTDPQVFNDIVIKVVPLSASKCSFDLKTRSSFNLPDCAYKLYRFLRVFLI